MNQVLAEWRTRQPLHLHFLELTMAGGHQPNVPPIDLLDVVSHVLQLLVVPVELGEDFADVVDDELWEFTIMILDDETEEFTIFVVDYVSYLFLEWEG